MEKSPLGYLSVKKRKAPPDSYKYENHMGILGINYLVKALKPKIVLIGEYGMEFKEQSETIMTNLRKELDTPSILVDLGLKILVQSIVSLAYNNVKTIDEIIAKELMLAAKNDPNSRAVKRKDEIERMAVSAR